jgi:hypothetical protein
MSRAPQKRFLDIEMALRWAYRDELPKRERGGPTFEDLARGPPADFGNDDGAVREPGFPAALGEPHPDALMIEAAVRALAQWRGHTFGQDPDNSDPAGLTWGFTGLDAGHVQAAAEAIAMMTGLVTCHARAGTRPAWSRELPRPFPGNGGNGKPRVLVDEIYAEIYDRRRDKTRHVPVAGLPRGRAPAGAPIYTEAVPAPPLRKDVYRMGAYCPLEWRPAPAKIAAGRAEYAAWRMGLQLLWQALEGALSSIAPLPPAAPWRPWCFDKGSAGARDLHGRPPELFRGRTYKSETREQAAARRRLALRRAPASRSEETRPTRSPSAGRRNGAA